MDLTRWLRAQWDRAGAWVLILVGVVALCVGWAGVSGTAFPAEQLPYVVSGGIGGIFLLGLGATLWLSADLRDEWRKLDRLEQILSGEPAAADSPSAAAAAPAPVPAEAGTAGTEPAEGTSRRRRRTATTG